MPYLSTEKVSEYRKAIKAKFPEFRFSIRNRDYSSIAVAIKSGPIDFETEYEQVNQYYTERHWAHLPEAAKMLTELCELLMADQREEVYDGDYGSVPTYYVDVSIGQWDKPYVIKK